MDVKKYIPQAASAFAGIGVGTLGTYLILKKRFADISQAEIDSVKETFEKRSKTGDFATPESAVEALISPEEQAKLDLDTMLEENGYNQPKVTQIDGTPAFIGTPREVINKTEEELRNLEENARPEKRVKYSNIFDNDEPQPAEEAIFVSVPNPEEPYIISTEEFMQESDDFSKVSLTYYDEDDTLVEGDRRVIIPPGSYDSTVSIDALSKFGTGSKDKNFVHVRNEPLEVDYEILRITGSYAKLVLGFGEDDDDSSPQKMRDDE